MEIRHRNELFKLLDLYSLPRVVAEIGVAEGLFSRDMLAWGIDKFYCVDTWKHQPAAKGDINNNQEWHDANYANAEALRAPFEKQTKIRVLQGFSTDMHLYVPDEELGLLYLDADHSYAGVLSDLSMWYPKVVPGGIIAGHDFLNTSYGVKDAVYEFCKGRFDVQVIPEHKQEDAGFWFQKRVK